MITQFIGDAESARKSAQDQLFRLAPLLGYLEKKSERAGYRPVTDMLFLEMDARRDACVAIGAKWTPQMESDYLWGSERGSRDYEDREARGRKW